MSDPRDDQLVLAVDLGTGGPKVGFVTVTGRVVWQDHILISSRRQGRSVTQDA